MTHAYQHSGAQARSSARELAVVPSRAVVASASPSARGYAACASYAFHDEATRFGTNRLTGRAQSLADRTGWLVNTQA